MDLLFQYRVVIREFAIKKLIVLITSIILSVLKRKMVLYKTERLLGELSFIEDSVPFNYESHLTY